MLHNNTDTEPSNIELAYITNQQVGVVLSSMVPAKHAQKAAELKQAKRDLERIATECRSGIELALDDKAPAEDAQTGSARNERKRRATDTTLPGTPSGKKQNTVPATPGTGRSAINDFLQDSSEDEEIQDEDGVGEFDRIGRERILTGRGGYNGSGYLASSCLE